MDVIGSTFGEEISRSGIFDFVGVRHDTRIQSESRSDSFRLHDPEIHCTLLATVSSPQNNAAPNMMMGSYLVSCLFLFFISPWERGLASISLAFITSTLPACHLFTESAPVLPFEYRMTSVGWTTSPASQDLFPALLYNLCHRSISICSQRNQEQFGQWLLYGSTACHFDGHDETNAWIIQRGRWYH